MNYLRTRKKIASLAILVILLLCVTAGQPVVVATASDSTVTQIFTAAAHSFAEQAEAAGNHRMTGEPVIAINSKQIQAGKMEVMMEIDAMDVLNSGSRDDQPVIAGQLQYLQDHGAALSATAKKAIEDDIAYWRSTIDSAMIVPTETCYPIKITANVDIAGNIDISTLQVYVDNGAVGSNFIPAAQFFKDMLSVWVTVGQAYDSAASLAMDISAKGSVAPATTSSSYNRNTAYQYADTWVKDTTIMCDTVDVTYQNNANWNNGQYPNYQNFYCNDCADYVSQCLRAGGIPTTSSWSYSPYTANWGNVGPLKDYLLNHGYITYGVTLKNCVYGDPFFFDVGGTLVHTVFMVYNDGTTFKYDAHTNDRLRLNWTGTLGGYVYHYAHVVY
jgi:hypothetical protein